MSSKKSSEADALSKKASKLLSPSLVKLRLKPDTETACPMFERSALLHRQAGNLAEAKCALEQASRCQEMMRSPFHAAKLLVEAGHLARELGDPEDSGSLLSAASDLYAEVSRLQPAGQAAADGAESLQDSNPERAAALYAKALKFHEQDGKLALETDTCGKAVQLAAKRKQWLDAVTMLLRLAAASNQAGAVNNAHRCYLGATVLLLSGEDANMAWQTYQDCLEVASFSASQEAAAAEGLFAAYQQGSEDGVKSFVKSNSTFKFLETYLTRMALQLPQGDLEAMSGQLQRAMNDGEAGEASDDDADPDDLT